MCLPNILFPVFMFAFIFHCRSFSPCWPLAFLIFSPPLWISMFFFLRNSSPLFSITRSSSFSVIHVSVNIKNNAEKEPTLLMFFLSNHVMYDRGAWFLRVITSSSRALCCLPSVSKNMTSSFASLSEQDIEKMVEDKDSQNTEKSMKVAKELFAEVFLHV